MTRKADTIVIIVLSILCSIRSCHSESLSLDSTAGFPYFPSTEYGTTNQPLEVERNKIDVPNIRDQYPKGLSLYNAQGFVRYAFSSYRQTTDGLYGDRTQLISVNVISPSPARFIIGWSSIEERDPAGNVVQSFDQDELDLDDMGPFPTRQGFVIHGPLKDRNKTRLTVDTVHSWQRSTYAGEYKNIDESADLYNNSLLYSFTIKGWQWKSQNNYLNITWSTEIDNRLTNGEAIGNTTDAYSDSEMIRVDRVYTDGNFVRQSFLRNAKADKEIRSVNFTFLPDTNKTLESKKASLGYVIQRYFNDSLTINSVYNFYYDESRKSASGLKPWQLALIIVFGTFGGTLLLVGLILAIVFGFICCPCCK